LLEKSKNTTFIIKLNPFLLNKITLPNLSFNSFIKISSYEFNRICNSFYPISSNLFIELNKNNFNLKLNSKDINGGYTYTNTDNEQFKCFINYNTNISIITKLHFLIKKIKYIIYQILYHFLLIISIISKLIIFLMIMSVWVVISHIKLMVY